MVSLRIYGKGTNFIKKDTVESEVVTGESQMVFVKGCSQVCDPYFTVV